MSIKEDKEKGSFEGYLVEGVGKINYRNRKI